jgi:hypothetical protein
MATFEVTMRKIVEASSPKEALTMVTETADIMLNPDSTWIDQIKSDMVEARDGAGELITTFPAGQIMEMPPKPQVKHLDDEKCHVSGWHLVDDCGATPDLEIRGF